MVDLPAADRRWLRPRGWDQDQGFSTLAYNRMAEQVLTLMASESDLCGAEGIAVLTKCLALIYAKDLKEATVDEMATEMQHWTNNLIIEIINLQKARKYPTAGRGFDA